MKQLLLAPLATSRLIGERLRKLLAPVVFSTDANQLHRLRHRAHHADPVA